MGQPVGVYPFSTQDGKAIPLDIIRPKGLIICAFTPAALLTVSHCTIPDGTVVGVLTSSAECIVRFGPEDIPSVLEDGTLYEDTVFIPAGGGVTVVLQPGPISVTGTNKAGALFIQIIDQWAGLGLPTQYGRK